MKYRQNVVEIWTEFRQNLDSGSVWMKFGHILDFKGGPTLTSSAQPCTVLTVLCTFKLFFCDWTGLIVVPRRFPVNIVARGGP